ncbi:MAG: type IV secretion system DNA-binding domain-containing protein [Patescibacteria group bacterium]
MDNSVDNQIVYFGHTNFRNNQVKFGIKTDDRRRHMYVIGKTGMGKSTLLENMVIQDIRMGHGVAYVDPHGDTVEKLLNYIPSSRINDVVYFNPSDNDFPIAFNVLESVDDPMKKNLVASGLIAVFKKLWADSWGPRLEYLLRNAILALLDYPGATLLGVTRMMVDKEFRKKVIAKIKDPVVKSFWVDEYSKYNNSFQVEAISPIQNKVGQFLSMSLIRNIVGQVKSSIDIRDIMDNKKILLLNLSKGRIGEDASALLGAMMITRMQLAAMSRVDIKEDDRKDFYLYVDEFQNFATDSFANILSEARKYRLNLVMAHQYIEQLSEAVRAAVFGNVGTLVTFRVGAEDAEFLGKEFTPTFNETDLVNLAKYDLYLKLMIDGVTSDPFSATGIPPELGEMQDGHRDKIVKVSRERYATGREVIEDKIARWSGVDDSVIEGGEGGEKSEEEGFHSPCSVCGKDVVTKFQPDGVRPVFCDEHLKAFKEGKIDRSQFEKKQVVKNEPVTPEPKKLVVSSKAEVAETAPVAPETMSAAELSLTEALTKSPTQFSKKPKSTSVRATVSEEKKEEPKKESPKQESTKDKTRKTKPPQPEAKKVVESSVSKKPKQQEKPKLPVDSDSGSQDSGSLKPGATVTFE